MTLLQKPDKALLKYVALIQRLLSSGPIDQRRAGLERFARRLIDSSDPEEDLAQGLPEEMVDGHQMIFDTGKAMQNIAQLATSASDVPTLIRLYMLWNEAESAARNIADHYQHTNTKVLLASVLSKDHNARVFQPEQYPSVSVVLFSNRLFQFIDEIASIIPLAVFINEHSLQFSREIVPLVLERSNFSRQENPLLKECLDAFRSRFIEAPPGVKRFSWKRMTETGQLIALDIENAIQYFVIAHELGHILCNHLDSEKSWNLRPSSEKGQESEEITIQEVIRNWDQEYEADYLGLRLGLYISKRNGIDDQLFYWGVLLFYSANIWLDAAQKQEGNRPEYNDLSDEELMQIFPTHPPFHKRLNWIQSIIHDLNESGEAEAVNLSFIEDLDAWARAYLKLPKAI